MKILVIGDSCTDTHIYGKVERLCPEAPVPVLIPTKTVENGGMAANVYENIKSLDVPVDIITNTNVTTKVRFVDEYTNQMIVRVDYDDIYGVFEKHIPHKILLNINFEEYDAVVVSDYNKGFLDYKDIKYICERHECVFIDTKKIIDKEHFMDAKYIKINEHEYYKNIELWARTNQIDSFNDKLIITMGSRGCRYKEKLYPVQPVEVKDMSGAGDTFLSGLVVRYVGTHNIDEAIEFANQCATIVVQHRGVSKIGDYLK